MKNKQLKKIIIVMENESDWMMLFENSLDFNYVIFTFPGADILLRVSSSGRASLEKVCE